MQETLGTVAVFDDRAIGNLTGHADDATTGRAFATRFRDLLPHRLWRIAQALEDGDEDRALDAVLSLKVSAATLGARQLSALAGGVERGLRAGDLGESRRAADQLGGAARRLHDALAGHIGDATR